MEQRLPAASRHCNGAEGKGLVDQPPSAAVGRSFLPNLAAAAANDAAYQDQVRRNVDATSQECSNESKRSAILKGGNYYQISCAVGETANGLMGLS